MIDRNSRDKRPTTAFGLQNHSTTAVVEKVAWTETVSHHGWALETSVVAGIGFHIPFPTTWSVLHFPSRFKFKATLFQ